MSEIQHGAEAALRLVETFRGLEIVAKALVKIGSFENYEQEVAKRVVEAKRVDAQLKLAVQETEKVLLDLQNQVKTERAALAVERDARHSVLGVLDQRIAEAEQAFEASTKDHRAQKVQLENTVAALAEQEVLCARRLADINAKIEKKVSGLAALR